MEQIRDRFGRGFAKLLACAALIGHAVFGSTLTGCGAAPAADGWRAVTDTIADTVVVRTVAGSVWGDTARLVEELRIGSMEGADPYVIGNPVSIAVGNGAVYVLDAQVPVVRMYDAATGEHVRDLGREGGGPGEYNSPDGVAVLPDGRVLVRSPRVLSINVYGPDGEFREAWAHPSPGFHTYERFHVDTAGIAWITTILAGHVPWEWEYGLIGVEDGAVVDTVPVHGRLGYERTDVTAAREHSASRRQVPFTGDLVWSFSPYGRLVESVTSRYAIYLFAPEGPVLRIERKAGAIPVHPEEAEERRARITRGLQRQYGSWKWNGAPVPDSKPPLRALFADDDGRVWAVVSQPGRPVVSASEAEATEARTGRPVLRYQEPPAVDLFDRDGRYLGPVAAPEAMEFEDPNPVARGDTVWAVERDAVGVPTVVRYRLERGAGTTGSSRTRRP